MIPDRYVVRQLLAEAVTSLCYSRLHYRSQVKIQGRLDITVDNNESFAVYINELLTKAADCQTLTSTNPGCNIIGSSNQSVGSITHPYGVAQQSNQLLAFQFGSNQTQNCLLPNRAVEPLTQLQGVPVSTCDSGCVIGNAGCYTARNLPADSSSVSYLP